MLRSPALTRRLTSLRAVSHHPQLSLNNSAGLLLAHDLPPARGFVTSGVCRQSQKHAQHVLWKKGHGVTGSRSLGGVWPGLSTVFGRSGRSGRLFAAVSGWQGTLCEAAWSRRYLSTPGSNGQYNSDTLPLQLGERGEVRVPLVWLRDHCQCDLCYNSATYQKNTDNYSLKDLALAAVVVRDDVVYLTWKDGHETSYSLQWIADNFYSPPTTRVERFLWDSPRLNEQPLPVTSYDSHMTSEEGLRNTLSNVIKYGIAFVDGVPGTAEATEKVMRRVCHLMEVWYGSLITMVSGQFHHQDTAFTNLYVGPHTDTTYFNAPAGIQVFHALHHDGEGGKTLLVDGFHAANKLRMLSTRHFDSLVTCKVPHQSREEGGHHMYCVGSVLSADSVTGDVTHIRYNPYDRAPLSTLPPDDVIPFCVSYDALTDVIQERDSGWWVKLRAGTVLLVDNWRVLHGRSAFTGQRIMCGGYLPRDDWTSKARQLGLM